MTKEVKIALVAIAALIALYFGINFLKGLSLFSSSSTYYLTFANAKGLTNSTAIFADGYRVGSVTDIEYDYENQGHIKVKADITPELRIPAGSKVMIESDLMGNQKVSLLLATNPTQRIEPGQTIEGVEEQGLMTAVGSMMPQVEAMLPKLDSIMAALNTLLSDPALPRIVHNMEGTTANLEQTSAQLNTLMAGMNKQLPALVDNANTTMANAAQLTDNLNKIDLQQTMAKVDRTLQNVEQLTKTLNSNEGTLGQLMHDPALYNNLNRVVSDADSLMVDFKARPKRYIHFSVFGSKQK